MSELRKLLFLTTGKLIKFMSGKGLGKIPLLTTFNNYFYWYFKPSGTILLNVQGSKLYVESRDTGLTPFLLEWGVYEKYETELFKKIIKKNMVVVDIGANIGYYTLLAARCVGEEGKVFAFEPDPHNFSLLCKNVAVNGYENVFPIPKAVFNKSRKMKLFLDKSNLGGHSLSEANVNKSDYVITDTISLDDYFKNIDFKIHLIKMDVQGSEMRVLEGMANIIRQNDNLKIITEFWPLGIQNSGSSPKLFLNRLLEYGFTLYQIGRTLELVDVNHLMSTCVSNKFVTLYCTREH